MTRVAGNTRPTKGPERGGVRRVLVERQFGPFFLALVVSNSGSWIQTVAAVTLAWEMTGSGTMVGLVAAANHVPVLLLSAFTGMLADRVDKRRLIIASQLGAGVAATVLAIVSAGPVPMSPLSLVGLVALVAVGRTFGQPAMGSVVPSLVAESDVPQGFAFQTMSHTTGRAVGPLVGAMLYALGGPPLAFAANAISFAAPVIVFARMRQLSGKPPSPKGGVRLKEWILGDQRVGILLLGVGALAIGSDPVVTLSPMLAVRLDAGSQVVGVLMSAYGVGAVSTSFLVGRATSRISPRRLGAFGLLGVSAGLVIVALSPVLAVAVIALFLCGCGHMCGVAGLTSQLLLAVPRAIHGQLMGLWGVCLLGFRSLAAVAHGSLADQIGVRWAFSVAIVATGTLGLVVSRSSPGPPVQPAAQQGAIPDG